jgi:hypothetical protein
MTASVRPLLVNENEIQTDKALREAAEALGYRVSPKVRMAAALAIDRSGVSDVELSYALRSHFDWVVSDWDTQLPEFAVEFDGESHQTDDARRRDGLKDSTCHRLDFPLLRIDRFAFRPVLRDTVLGYLVNSWVAYRGFYEAQESGHIPLDEIFTPWAVIDGIDEAGNVLWRDLAGPARRLIARLHQAGVLTEFTPWHAMRSHTSDDPDYAEAYAWVETADGELVVGHVRIRSYSFPAVLPFELADDLAHMDLGDRLARLREGDRSVLVDREGAGLPEIGPRSGWSSGGPAKVALS